MRICLTLGGLILSCSACVSGYGDEFLPSIKDTILIEEWLYAGPFSTGAREGIVGAIEDPQDFRPRKGMEHASIMVQGGRVRWKEATSRGGILKLEFEDVWWDTLQDIYGIAGVIDAAYAYGEFDNKDGRRRALVVAERVGSFILNGEIYPGEVYGHDYARIPVILEDGLNRVLVKVGGAGDHEFTFRLIPAPSPLMVITKDATLPDLLRGKPFKGWAGVSVLNTTSKTVRGAVLSAEGPAFEHTERVVENLPPLSVVKVPIMVETRGGIEEGETATLKVAVAYGDQVSPDTLSLRIRGEGESFKKTFISRIDGSCQYYAVLPPKDYRAQQEYGLILTLHGAGVEASGQVDAYSKKDWAFVVAPTNRRRFGFDWQDWGRLDCLEVLEEMRRSHAIDGQRIYLTGHSMGGHGVWHIGLSHPDLFAAIAPSAGWTSFQLYVPWFLQKSYLFAHPEQLAPREMVLREDNPLLFLENSLNLPIFILQGGADDNVPPVQARFFFEGLLNLGYDFVYREVPGKGHWWDEEGIEGVACVDHPDLISFLKNHTRNPYPREILFRTTDLGLNNSSYWLEIDEQERLYGDSKVKAIVRERRIEVELENVARFTLHLSKEVIPPGDVEVRVNGQLLRHRFERAQSLSIHRDGERYVTGRKREKGLRKSPSLYGPIKQVYFSPFLLVYGTAGDSSSTQTNLHHARLQAFSWWMRGNGFARVLPDTEVTEQEIKDYNLVLFGNQETNGIVRRINPGLPVWTKGGRVHLGNRQLPYEDLALQVVYPNPLNPDKLVALFAATSPRADRFSGFFSTLYSGAGLPDFIVYDQRVRTVGWGGVLAAGFFDQNWKLSPDLMWVRAQ